MDPDSLLVRALSGKVREFALEGRVSASGCLGTRVAADGNCCFSIGNECVKSSDGQSQIAATSK